MQAHGTNCTCRAGAGSYCQRGELKTRVGAVRSLLQRCQQEIRGSVSPHHAAKDRFRAKVSTSSGGSSST